MADIVIETRLAAAEADLKDHEKRLDELDGRDDAHSDRILSLEHWRNGNGARGAEARLQYVEGEMEELRGCLGASKTDEAIERIAAAAARSIVKGARERDRTAVEQVKAWAPYFAALCGLGAGLIGLLR